MMLESGFPKVSVIIPIYNVERYLDECLASVKNQTYSNFEALLVDDGSTDHSADIAEKYEREDNRFRLYKKQNGGQGSARNYALERATGEFVAFLDSDDYLEKEYLQKLVRHALENDADVAVCGVKRVWDNGRVVDDLKSEKPDNVTADIHQYLLETRFISCDKLYRRDLFAGIRFPDIKYEDFATIPRVIARARKIVTFSDGLYDYRWREQSTTNDSSWYEDIYSAQQMLEQTELREGFRDVLQVYFVKMVIGSLVLKLIVDDKNWEKIRQYIEDGKQKYPHLENSLKKDYISSPVFGRLVLHNHFRLAQIYIAVRMSLRQALKAVYLKLEKAHRAMKYRIRIKRGNHGIEKS